MIVYAMLLGGFAQPIAGETNDSCTRRISIELERSDDGPEQVAEATLSACDPTEAPAPPDNIYAHLSLTDREQLRSVKRRILASRVTRLRACRKTPGCDLSSVQ